MARLNEPALSTAESIELLRRKMLRQNRELAKSNHSSQARTRELERELQQSKAEIFELRQRIIELEHEAQENNARRIVEYALTVKEKLISHLAEWGTLVTSLGLEAPISPTSPQFAAVTQRASFVDTRPTPSQRRHYTQDVASVVEQLGNIAEDNTFLRESASADLFQALSEEEDERTTEQLPPAPINDREPAKTDTPPREARARNFSSNLDSSPLVVSSPDLDRLCIRPTSSTTIMTPMIRESRVHKDPTSDTPIILPIKTGSKRKYSRNQYEPMTLEKVTDENLLPQTHAQGVTLLEKSRGKTLRELTNEKREAARAKADAAQSQRVPLGKKSTNDDVQSPKKRKKTNEESPKKSKTTHCEQSPKKRKTTSEQSPKKLKTALSEGLPKKHKTTPNEDGTDKISRSFILSREERKLAQEARIQEDAPAPNEEGTDKTVRSFILSREERRLAQEAKAQEDALAQEKLAQKNMAQEKLAQETVAQEKVAQEARIERHRRNRSSLSYAEPSLKVKLRRSVS
ncbi:hypothetical protein LMH87_009517 [Akanthomyces muscarius]|uniref:Shugoshin n=1 Tax=Akanthomyces muscarius TaxID=2231603 RepID=A0A9W8QEU7_AKAMU|nr:hypothetical protein LMH87_009517 [Akanthomyces muscarius]KAJ4153004.1 hypothetical protein LMH87_009517 [Akanthomyces muscarius]